MAKPVKKSETAQESEHGISTFTEYKLPFSAFCLGVSDINGRYPQSGTDTDKLYIDNNLKLLVASAPVRIPEQHKPFD